MTNLLMKLTGTRDVSKFGLLSTSDAMWMKYNGHQYPITGTMPGAEAQSIDNDFLSYVSEGYKGNGLVGSAVSARAYAMSQIVPVWEHDDGTMSPPVAKFASPSPLLDRSAFMAAVEMHVSLAGNAYVYDPSLAGVGTAPGGLRMLRPDLVDVIMDSDANPEKPGTQLDSRIVGYLYYPNGRHDEKTEIIPAAQVAPVTAVEVDPINPWRGLSWVTGVVREIIADGQATKHVSNFYEHSATANLVVKTPEQVVTRDQFNEWVEVFDLQHKGADNAWRTMYLQAGSDVSVVGSNLAELDSRSVVGGFETRIAARSRVHPVILGSREGMQGASLNAGNYAQVRRLWADGWLVPHADAICSQLERISKRPLNGQRLTFDRDRVLLLQEDQLDAAEVFKSKASAARQLIDAGFEPDSVVEAASTTDLRKLEHSGRISVQLLPEDVAGEVDDDDDSGEDDSEGVQDDE